MKGRSSLPPKVLWIWMPCLQRLDNCLITPWCGQGKAFRLRIATNHALFVKVWLVGIWLLTSWAWAGHSKASKLGNLASIGLSSQPDQHRDRQWAMGMPWSMPWSMPAAKLVGEWGQRLCPQECHQLSSPTVIFFGIFWILRQAGIMKIDSNQMGFPLPTVWIGHR